MTDPFNDEPKELADALVSGWGSLTEPERNALRDVLGAKPVMVDGLSRWLGEQPAEVGDE